MRHLHTAALAAVIALAGAASAAEGRASTQDAELLVKKAVRYLKQQGNERAVAAFNDPGGPFTFRDLYVIVYDLGGRCVAHGQDPGRVGKNLLADRDPDGRPFVQEGIQIAREQGRGWQRYRFWNPVTREIAEKDVYLERVGELVVASGAYRPR